MKFQLHSFYTLDLISKFPDFETDDHQFLGFFSDELDKQ